MGFACTNTARVENRTFIASSHGFILFASLKISHDMGGNILNLHGQLSSELSLLSASLHFLLLCSQRGDEMPTMNDNGCQFFWLVLLQLYQGKVFGDIWLLYLE